MARYIHIEIVSQVLADAGLTAADTPALPIAAKLLSAIRARGIAGVDLDNATDQQALAAALGGVGVDLLMKAIKLAKASGRVDRIEE